MPSREEIVGWMRQAASEISPDGLDPIYDVLMERAAKVEAMRCETCNWWVCDIRWNPDKLRECTFLSGKMSPPYFGCFHHEQKPAG